MKHKRVYKKVDLGDLISGICKRPKMYVGNDGFRSVSIYIDGFSLANEETFNEIQEFRKWLANNLQMPPNWIWSAMIEKRYPKSELALEKLSELFEKFRESCKKLDSEILH